jgi:hypothetical protein
MPKILDPLRIFPGTRDPTIGRLGLFCDERIHNHRPSRIDPFQYENSIINCSGHEIPLCHIGFVRVHVDEPRGARIAAANRMANFPYQPESTEAKTANQSGSIVPPKSEKNHMNPNRFWMN